MRGIMRAQACIGGLAMESKNEEPVSSGHGFATDCAERLAAFCSFSNSCGSDGFQRKWLGTYLSTVYCLL